MKNPTGNNAKKDNTSGKQRDVSNSNMANRKTAKNSEADDKMKKTIRIDSGFVITN